MELKENKIKIGPYEAAAIFGENPDVTPLRLWQNMKSVDFKSKGLSKIYRTLLLFEVECLERHLATGFSEEIFTDATHPYIGFSAYVNEDYVVVPYYGSIEKECVLVMAQFAMYVTGRSKAIGLKIDDDDAEYIKVDANSNAQANIMNDAAKFYESLSGDVAPEPIDDEDYKIMYPAHKPGLVKVANSEDAALIEQAKILNAQISEEKKEYDRLTGQIRAYMEDAEGIVNGSGDVLVTYKSNKDSVAIDIDRLKSEHPEIDFKSYEVVKPGARVLRIK